MHPADGRGPWSVDLLASDLTFTYTDFPHAPSTKKCPGMSPSQENSHDLVPSATLFTTGITNPQRPEPAPPAEPTPDPTEEVPSPGRTEVWDVPFDRVTLRQTIEHIEHLITRGLPSYVITANLNYVMLHHRSPDIRRVTKDADLVVADGQPIVWRSKLGADTLPQRVAGSELIYALAKEASLKGWGIYFLGGQPGVAGTCAERLATLYPGLKIAGVESPPFRDLSDAEQTAQDERIRNSDADLLLVAFGQPKGEVWIHEHYKRLGIPVSIQLGASFDFIAGTATRAPLMWQRLGLEWAHRMLTDPRRLAPRYAANASFLLSALTEDWKRKVTSWGMGEWTAQSSSRVDRRA
jgi:N-acetylglucosaminyldiphosphoundecaprenol N-acetyl-beta-D-mannosaminyltransferase